MPNRGYQCVKRTYDRLKLYVTWLGMFYYVQDYISKYKVWQKNKLASLYIKAPLQETDTQYQPWDKILDCGTLTYD